MSTDNVRETIELKRLRAEAQLGIAALDRGEFKDFVDASGLVAHLNKLAEDILSGARSGIRGSGS
jgi:antitoxin ParD1/3/4